MRYFSFSVQNLPSGTRVIRVMPNIPCLVRSGASVFVAGSNATSDDKSLTDKLLKAVGTCEEVSEYFLDPVTALSGSGPAYVSFFFPHTLRLPFYYHFSGMRTHTICSCLLNDNKPPHEQETLNITQIIHLLSALKCSLHCSSFP